MTWVSFDGESKARELLLHPSFLLSDSVEGLEHIMTPSCINDSSNWQVDVPTHVPWNLGPAFQAPSQVPSQETVKFIWKTRSEGVSVLSTLLLVAAFIPPSQKRKADSRCAGILRRGECS